MPAVGTCGQALGRSEKVAVHVAIGRFPVRALQYRQFGRPPEVVDIPTPVPGPGQVLLRVLAAGACHSDLTVLRRAPDEFTFGRLPLTLGHEGAGVVASVGAGVKDVSVGEAMVVYGPWGCGRCQACARGEENSCPVAAGAGIRPPGLGAPGSMAQFQLIDNSRHLVPLGDLDPVANVALTDAGLTPYHAIARLLPRLRPGSVAVVIGVGGLGHAAIQLLRALSSCTVVGVDISAPKLVLATEVGAHHVAMAEEVAETLGALTGVRGVDVVLDMVGSNGTTELARSIVGMEGEIVVIGVGAGAVPIGYRTTAFGAAARSTYWGSRPELYDVIELARSGHLTMEIETFSLEEAPLAYERLAAGDIRGRAVIVPEHDC